MEDELSSLAEKLRSTRTAAKEKALFITDHYEVYIGKDDAGETRGACGYREKRRGIQYQ